MSETSKELIVVTRSHTPKDISMSVSVDLCVTRFTAADMQKTLDFWSSFKRLTKEMPTLEEATFAHEGPPVQLVRDFFLWEHGDQREENPALGTLLDILESEGMAAFTPDALPFSSEFKEHQVEVTHTSRTAHTYGLGWKCEMKQWRGLVISDLWTEAEMQALQIFFVSPQERGKLLADIIENVPWLASEILAGRFLFGVDRAEMFKDVRLPEDKIAKLLQDRSAEVRQEMLFILSELNLTGDEARPPSKKRNKKNLIR